jgi:hypothetical protein
MALNRKNRNETVGRGAQVGKAGWQILPSKMGKSGIGKGGWRA